MRIWVYALSAAILLAGCSADEEKNTASEEEAGTEENKSEDYNKATNTEGEEKPLSVAELEGRIEEGMNIDAYSAEVQS